MLVCVDHSATSFKFQTIYTYYLILSWLLWNIIFKNKHIWFFSNMVAMMIILNSDTVIWVDYYKNIAQLSNNWYISCDIIIQYGSEQLVYFSFIYGCHDDYNKY